MKSEHVADTKIFFRNLESVSGLWGYIAHGETFNGKCVTCKKIRRKPLEQLMGQILRLCIAVVFPVPSNTAIDMFGPP